MKKVSVLYVDAAVEYGGSLVVISNLMNALEKRYYRPVMVGEIDIERLKMSINSDTHIYIIPRIYNYAHWIRTIYIINRLPGRFLRKTTNYLLSVVRGLVNTVYLVRLAIVVLKEKVNIIHVSNGMYNLAPVLCAVILGRKFVVHIHGMEIPGFIQRILIRRVPVFIAVSEYMKTGLIRNGYPEDRLTVIPNPVCPKKVSPEQTSALRKCYGLDEADHVLGIVGRIARWKGHVEFLAAANMVMRSVPKLKVLIVGEFSGGNTLYRNEITRIVEDSGFKDRIVLTGHVHDVERHYSLMDVCVHASIEPEPFGLVITEAMACGVPVIASDLGAPREIITDGENGFLVNPNETVKLAETIIRLLEDADLRSSIGIKGREHVLKRYQPRAFAHSMEQLYMNVLQEAE